MSYFRLHGDASVHKDWIHATDRPIYNFPSKSKFSKIFEQLLPGTKETCLVSFF